jgi:hypothetical protein
VGLIRLWLFEGAALVADSGTIIDDGPESLRGGRLGVYCDSQEQITWLVFSAGVVFILFVATEGKILSSLKFNYIFAVP